ncbi:MAG: hypothetical protein WC787_04940 [Patescibacteria group bacterium]|jgi:hypothetical protein
MDEFGNPIGGFDIASFLVAFGDNPFAAMWFLFTHGGFLIFFWMAWFVASQMWLGNRQMKYAAAKQWMVLAIDIPRLTEQTPRAVENIFAHWAGAHSPNSWKEKWFDGRSQDTISVEMISIEGQVQFIVRTTRNLRDLIEASIYAQYPDAEIVEVEDYVKKVPHHFPDKEWDIFGTEMIPAKHGLDLYPLRTYPEFEDKVSGEFKDPLAVLLENLSRLGPGEQAWYQIVLTPIDQVDFRKKGENLIKKLTGQKVETHKGFADKALEFPLTAMNMVLETTGIIAGTAAKKPESNPLNSRMWTMTPGERKVVEAVENKMSKIAYSCKVRFMLVAKKELMKKSRFVHPFIGFIKQYNTNDMLALKPESKHVGMNNTLWFFKERRNNERRNHFMHMFAGRSNWAGTENYYLNIEELATLWHFPISMQVRSPQLKKTESKRSEPPMNLPYM